MDKPYDRSGKWLVTHYGNALVSLGGAKNIRRWRPLQAELVQPAQLPDGLIEVYIGKRKKPVVYNVEIATYPERRVVEQMARGAMLVYLDRRELPEALTIVLRPKGQYRLPRQLELFSPSRQTKLTLEWTVVEVWNLPVKQLLEGDVGLVPLAPLAHFDEPAQPIFERCRERIEQDAPQDEKENLLAVTQVMARLRFHQNTLFNILGGRRIMIESPLIRDLVAEQRQKDILMVLKKRFNEVPADVDDGLKRVKKENEIDELMDFALDCPNLDAFRSKLPAPK